MFNHNYRYWPFRARTMVVNTLLARDYTRPLTKRTE